MTEVNKLQQLQDDQRVWSDKTFDNETCHYHRSIAISHYLQKESKELTEAIENYLQNPADDTCTKTTEELADCLLLLLDCAAHLGFSTNYLITAAKAKYEINQSRKWGSTDANGVVEHIREK